VSDASGARIPEAQVELRQSDTNQARSLQTNEQGIFRASDLPIGTYEVRCTRPGFAPYLHVGVIVELGAAVSLDIVLRPADVSQQVTVSAQPSMIGASQTSVTFQMDYETVEETPLRTRDYLDFTLLAPDVSSSNRSRVSVSQTPLADSGFTFGGLRARSNTLSIDGLDNNDEYAGASRTALSVEVVSEFQVVNNGMSAEFGGASGGAINIVSKPGTDFVHGDVFMFAQSGVFNARPYLQSGSGSPDMGRYRGGLSLRGPIVQHRTFFSTAFEQESSHIQMGSDIDGSLSSALNTFLKTGAFARLPVRNISSGYSPTAGAETEASARVDHQITPHNMFALRYAFRNRREVSNSFNNGGLADASAWGSSFIADHDMAGSLVTLLGTGSVSDLRFQVATRRAVLRTNDVDGPEIDIAGLVQFGRPDEGNSQRRENHYQVSYSFSTSRGRHLWKAGVTINRVGLRATVPDGFGGVYLFNTVSDFFAGRPDSFRQAFGNPGLQFAVTNYGTFVQDHWSLGHGFAVDVGARYDFEHLPIGFNEETNNFSPRIGLAYSPAPRWVVRAGYGIFFDRYVLAYLGRAVEKDGRNAFEQVVYGDEAATLFRGAGGGSLLAPAAGVAPSIFRADPHMPTAYSQQSNLGLEYLIEKNTTLGVNYLFVRGVHLSRTRNVNLLPPVQLTLQNAASQGIPNPTPQQIGRDVFSAGRFDPALSNIYQLENAASSTYHGLSLSLSRRLSELNFSANYTFSKTLDDASDFDEQPQNPFLTNAERALSRNHQKHRFVLSGLWELPSADAGLKRAFNHIELAPILTIGSGRPVDPLTGLDSNRSGAWPLSARPLSLSRNSLSTPSLVNMDFRINKGFPVGEHGHLSLMVDFFNMFNRRNVIQVNPIFGSGMAPLGGFGQPLESLIPRECQLALEYEF
jgi:outer membrane receptor protein involved in Fe transport